MSEVKLSVSAPKEVVDFLVALDGLTAKIAAKESAAQIASEELPVVLNLYGEAQTALSEVTSQTDEVLDAAELYVRRMVYRLLGKPVTPVVVG